MLFCNRFRFKLFTDQLILWKFLYPYWNWKSIHKCCKFFSTFPTYRRPKNIVSCMRRNKIHLNNRSLFWQNILNVHQPNKNLIPTKSPHGYGPKSRCVTSVWQHSKPTSLRHMTLPAVDIWRVVQVPVRLRRRLLFPAAAEIKGRLCRLSFQAVVRRRDSETEESRLFKFLGKCGLDCIEKHVQGWWDLPYPTRQYTVL